jgi:hypothetical protein
MPFYAVAEDVPGDGTCMFHSLALPLQTSGEALRDMVSNFIERHHDMKMHDTLISDWILWDTGMSPSVYVDKMRKKMWGGALEMTIISSILQTPIFVYSPKSGMCVRITEVRPDSTLASAKQSVPYLCLLYVGSSHYMCLRIHEI